MDRIPSGEFNFNKLFNKIEIISSRIKDEYVEYKSLTEEGKFKWVRRYELVWSVYKNKKRKFAYHIHHKNRNKLDDRPSNLIQLTRKQHCAVHGREYNTGTGIGSVRSYGSKFSDEARRRMSESLRGKTRPMDMFHRDDNWRRRISEASTGIYGSHTIKGISIRDVVNMRLVEKLSMRKIASELGVSCQTVGNRVRWFTDANGLSKNPELTKDLDSYIFPDEVKDPRSSKRYIVIKMRYLDSKPNYKTSEKTGWSIEKIERYLERFKVSNGFDSLKIYEIGAILRESDIKNFKL